LEERGLKAIKVRPEDRKVPREVKDIRVLLVLKVIRALQEATEVQV